MNENFVLKNFIEQLVAARRLRKIVQSELANKLGVAQSYVARVEAGNTNLRTTKLIELARLLGFELVLVPIELVPAVRALIAADKKSSVDLESEPLYSLSADKEEDDEA